MIAFRKTRAAFRGTWWALLGLVLSIQALDAQNLLTNGNFTSDVTGWSLQTDSGFGLGWDPTRGQPAPGSLRLSGTFEGVGSGVAEALSECFDRAPGTLFQARASVFAETTDGTVKCVPFVTRYEGAGCTGERTRLGFVAPVEETPPGFWQSATALAETSTALPSFRVSLVFWVLSGDGPASCNFDSVVLAEAGAAGVPEVPVTSTTALMLLSGLLGLSAVWLLRTRP